MACRRWDRARVNLGTRLRTAVGIVEVTGVEQVPATALRADDARADRAIFRVELRYGGTDPRETLRKAMPSPSEIAALDA